MQLTDKIYEKIYKQNREFIKKNEPTVEDRPDLNLEKSYKNYIKRFETAVDRDRIFSNVFRRLEHKAQVYQMKKETIVELV
jgi:dGTP triphosphohydrolase